MLGMNRWRLCKAAQLGGDVHDEPERHQFAVAILGANHFQVGLLQNGGGYRYFEGLLLILWVLVCAPMLVPARWIFSVGRS